MASLRIHVYNDTNRDGRFNTGEPGLPNREVEVTSLGDPSELYGSFTTDNNGHIECSLPAGRYRAEQQLLPNWCTNGDIASEVTMKDSENKTIYFGSYPCIPGYCEYRFTPKPGNFSSIREDENLIVKKAIDPYVLSLRDHDMTKGALINYTITVCAKPKIGSTDLVLAVDTSGSVIEGDKAALSEINRGINKFVQAMKTSKSADLRMGLVSWDSDIDTAVKPTFSYDEVLNASNRLKANPRELTMYQVGMNGSLAAFDASPREGARKVIVFITDARNEYEPFLSYPDPSKYMIYVLLLNKPEINETYDMLNSMAKRFGGKLIQVDDSAQIASALTSLTKTSLTANGTVNDIKIVDTLPSYLRPLNKGTKAGTLNVNNDGVNWRTNSLSWSIPAIQYGKCWSTTFTAVFCWKLQANVAEPLNSSRTVSQVEYANPANSGLRTIALPEGTIWIESDVNEPEALQIESSETEDGAVKKNGNEAPAFQAIFAVIVLSLAGYLYRRRAE
ncbi:MAG: von Willebrand factor type A domain protein [Methanosaeta sp. PtaU1.Bin112]|nr:MAG: von Willebrand factor type A domain protein [Methanosaeta sp. PtaU1.Bin112]